MKAPIDETAVTTTANGVEVVAEAESRVSPDSAPPTVEKIKRSEYLPVFAATGHESLKALLIVCAGSVAAFLAFLGTIIGNEKAFVAFGPNAIDLLFWALICFLVSTVLSLLTFAASFWSHACYYRDRDNAGDAWTRTAGVIGIAAIVFVAVGGYIAVSGLKAATALVAP